MNRVDSRLSLLCLLAIVMLAAGGGASEAATKTTTPNLPFPAANAPITSSAVAGSTLYVGGYFKRLGKATGTFASVDAASGKAAAQVPHADDEVYEVVSDNRGGWFLSGPFRAVGESTRHGLAHIDSEGNLDAGFHPKISQPGHLAVSPDGSTLYAVGDYENGGISHIEAIDTATGRVRHRFQTKNAIGQLVVSPNGKTLYACGVFLARPGSKRGGPGVALISAATGRELRFQQAPGQECSIALSPDGNRLYDIHGSYNHHLWKGHITAWSTTTHRPRWDQALESDGQPYRLVSSADGRMLYEGGAFTQINSKSRAHIAAFHAADGSQAPFAVGTAGNILLNPDIAGNVYALGIAKKTLYVGGVFTSLGGKPRYGLGAVNTATGKVTAWDPAPSGYVGTLAVSSDGKSVGVGGGFQAMGAVTRDLLAAIDLNTNSVTAFAPDFGANGYQLYSVALSPDGSTLYVGGAFSTVDGSDRSGIAAFSTGDGTLTSFDPGGGSARALVVSPDGSTLYAAVDHNLEAISTSTGEAIWTVSAGLYWDNALAVSPDGATLYVASSRDRPALTAVDTATGDPVAGFDPPIVSTDGADALVVSPDGSTLYAAGGFKLDGADSNAYPVVGFDAATGAVTFKPDVGGIVDALTLSADGNDLFIGGWLTSVGGAARGGVAELDLSNNGQVTSLNPDIKPDVLSDNPPVFTIATLGSKLLVGGDFVVDGQSLLDLAAFTIP